MTALTWLRLCDSRELTERGRAIRFAIDSPQGAGSAFVLRWRGRVQAYINRCQHIPMEMDWSPGQFLDESGTEIICATHGAAYAPDTGRCLGGPCRGRSLTPLRVEERDGAVWWLPDGQAWPGSGG